MQYHPISIEKKLFGAIATGISSIISYQEHEGALDVVITTRGRTQTKLWNLRGLLERYGCDITPLEHFENYVVKDDE